MTSPFAVVMSLCVGALAISLGVLAVDYNKRARLSVSPEPSRDFLKPLRQARDEAQQRLERDKVELFKKMSKALQEWGQARDNMRAIASRDDQLQASLAAIEKERTSLDRQFDVLLEESQKEQQRIVLEGEQTQNKLEHKPGPESQELRQQLQELLDQFIGWHKEFRSDVEQKRAEMNEQADAIVKESANSIRAINEEQDRIWIVKQLEQLRDPVRMELGTLMTSFEQATSKRLKEIDTAIDDMSPLEDQQKIKRVIKDIVAKGLQEADSVRQTIEGQAPNFKTQVTVKCQELRQLKKVRDGCDQVLDKLVKEVENQVKESLESVDRKVRDLQAALDEKALAGRLGPKVGKVLILVLGTENFFKEEAVLFDQLKQFLAEHKELDKRDTVQVVAKGPQIETWRPGRPLKVKAAKPYTSDEYTLALWDAYHVYEKINPKEPKIKVLVIWNGSEDLKFKRMVDYPDPPDDYDIHFFWVNPPKEPKEGMNILNSYFDKTRVRAIRLPELAAALHKQLDVHLKR